MNFAVIIPLIVLIIFTFILFNQKKFRFILNLRESIIISGITLCVLVSIVTEIFSFFNCINETAIISFWFLILLLSIIISVFFERKGYLSYKKILIPSFSNIEKLLIFYLVLNLIIIASIAWVSPPCNWDSMVSNVARIMHWVQNQNLNVFPTNIQSQFYYPPFAAIAIMQLQILSGVDYFSNFIQFFSMLGCLILVSLIAKKFSSSVKCQLFSVIICGTIPMLIVQASSTQYELLIAFFVLSFIYFIDKFVNDPNWMYSSLAGASLGLAIYTKPIAYLYIIPFFIVFILCILKKFDFSQFKKSFIFWIVRIFPMIVAILTLCTPYFYRNYKYFGNLLGDPVGLVTIEFSIPKLIANLLWNLGVHLQFFNPFNYEISSFIDSIIKNFTNLLNVDLNSIYTVTTFLIPVLNFNEDRTGSALHLLIISLTIVVFLIIIVQKKLQNKYINLYIFSIIFSFVIFCLFFNYNIYNIRYQLPLFIISAPLVGYLFSGWSNKKLAYLVLLLLLISSTPWVLLNETKPVIGYNSFQPIYPTINNIIGQNVSELINHYPPEFSQSIFERNRNDQYFNSNPYAREPFMALSKNISDQKYTNIGLDIKHGSPYDYEYPLWMLLKTDYGFFPRIEHVNVSNPSKNSTYNSLKEFEPDVIFSVQKGNNEIHIGDNVVIDDILYKKVKGYENYSLLTPLYTN